MNADRSIELAPDASALFEPLSLPNIAIKNRLFRSATYEGMADATGIPGNGLADLFTDLAVGGVGAIITGFAFVSSTGRAMQPRQCGIHTDGMIEGWGRIVGQVKRRVPDVRLFMQLAHTGRQTRRDDTGFPVAGVSAKRCSYFRQKLAVLDDSGIRRIVDEFAAAAGRARKAGFDGVQIHGAHGYLVHQFLSPWTNTRRDVWADGPLFLEAIVRAVRQACGADYPVLVKLSGAEDASPGIRIEDTIRTVRRLEALKIDAVEISYGAMEQALNIIRGDCPVDLVLRVNPLFNTIPPVLRFLWKRFRANAYRARLIPFSEAYNVANAARVKTETSVPTIAVGGMTRLASMLECRVNHRIDAVSLCRPLICEPDLPVRLRDGRSVRSACTRCNLCTIYCDSPRPVRCYRRQKETEHEHTVDTR